MIAKRPFRRQHARGGCARAILRALPNPCVVLDDVAFELQAGRRTGRGDADALYALRARRLVEHVRLGTAGAPHFAGLVSGPAAETLDDGEAATIACAVERDAIALIDERKAVRICAARFPQLVVGCAVDVLAQRNVRTALGPRLDGGVFNALDRGRVQAPDRCGPWVVDRIGRERAARRRSLPKRFRAGGPPLPA